MQIIPDEIMMNVTLTTVLLTDTLNLYPHGGK